MAHEQPGGDLCKRCVQDGFMTDEQLSAFTAAGDRTVVPIQDRIKQGEDAGDILDELISRMSPTQQLLFYLLPFEQQLAWLSGELLD